MKTKKNMTTAIKKKLAVIRKQRRKTLARADQEAWHAELDEIANRAKHPEISPLTLSVPEAGRRYFGLSRNGSFNAAARGDIPTVRVGKLLRVPIRALEKMLDKASDKR
jgi:hypothetical protein